MKFKWMSSTSSNRNGFIICDSRMLVEPLARENDLYIGHIADPDRNYNARFIQLVNPTLHPFSLGRYTNGNQDMTSNTIERWTGSNVPSIPANGSYVLCRSITGFASAYNSQSNPSITWPCDRQGRSGGVADSNGDDNLALMKNGVVIDMFGRVGQDGTNTDHEFEDGQALRIVAGPSRFYNASEWRINCDTSLACGTNRALRSNQITGRRGGPPCP